MKIIFASKFYYRRGGLESYMFNAKELLEAHGNQVIPFSTDYYQNCKTEYSGYFCKYYDLSKRGFSAPIPSNMKATVNMYFNKEAYRNMQKLIKKTKPDIVQGFGVTKHLSYSIFKAAKDMGIPTVMRLSDYALLCPNSRAADGRGELCPEFSCSKRNFKKILTRKCIHGSVLASLIGELEVKYNFLYGTYRRYVDYFIAPSRFLRNIFIQHYRISHERILYLPNFLEPGNIPFVDSDDGFFLFAGRLSNEKGVKTLLNAIAKDKRHKLIIAGTGPLEKEYREYSLKNKLNVEFVGFQDKENLQNMIKRCRAVIIPSECYENSPNIVLEAYSYNKPVIGTHIGGIPELVEDSKTGFLFEMGNVEELSEKMKLLYDNKGLAFEMGKNGERVVEEKFKPDMHYKKLMSFYESVLKKRILLVNNFYYNRGGDCTYLFSLKKLLEEKGHKVVVFSMHHPQNYDSKWSKYFVNYINYDEEAKKISFFSGLKVAYRTIFFLQARNKIRTIIREEKPDIVHLQNIQHHITPSIFYILKKYKIPIVWTLHDYTVICPNTSLLSKGRICERCKKRKYFWAPITRCKKGSFAASAMAAVETTIHRIARVNDLVDVFIAPSRFLRDKLIEYGFKEDKIIYLNNLTYRMNLLNEENVSDYYLYVGRVSEEKGIRTLIDAAIKVNSGKLKIVGEGTLKEEMVSYVESKNENNRIEFLGHRNRIEVIELLKNCSFVVLPSEWYENSPLSILEAFACGKPVIASRIGGIPEIVENWETGLLFEPGNLEYLSLKIRYFINHPDKAAEMGRNARVFIEQELNAERHYEKLMEIYKRSYLKNRQAG